MRHDARCECCGAVYTFGAVFHARCTACDGTFSARCETACVPRLPTYFEQVEAWARANNMDQPQ